MKSVDGRTSQRGTFEINALHSHDIIASATLLFRVRGVPGQHVDVLYGASLRRLNGLHIDSRVSKT